MANRIPKRTPEQQEACDLNLGRADRGLAMLAVYPIRNEYQHDRHGCPAEDKLFQDAIVDLLHAARSCLGASAVEGMTSMAQQHYEAEVDEEVS